MLEESTQISFQYRFGQIAAHTCFSEKNYVYLMFVT